MNSFWQMKNQIFSRTAQPIVMVEIFVIEGTEEAMQKSTNQFR